MKWIELCVIARKLPGATESGPRFSVDDTTFVRLLEDGATVLFAATPQERAALIAEAPNIYFTTERYRDLPAVLAHLAELDAAGGRARLVAAWRANAPEALVRARDTAPAEPAAPASRVRTYFLAYWTTPDKPAERRRFIRLGTGNLLTWFRAAWRGKALSERLLDSEAQVIDTAFERSDEEGLPKPKTDAQTLDYLRRFFDHAAEPHLVSGATDDDEGTEIEYFIFDDELLRSADALDKLPHPDRGARKHRADDEYRVLLKTAGRPRRPG